LLPFLLCCAGIAAAQETPAPANLAPTRDAQQGAPAALRLTLEDALARARKNSAQFQAALTDAGLARGDKSLARDALLPNVNYNTQYLYTQGNGPGNPVRYIANNAVHEYISQGNVHQILDLTSISNFRRVSAVAAGGARESGDRFTRSGRKPFFNAITPSPPRSRSFRPRRKRQTKATASSNLRRTLNMGGSGAFRRHQAELQMQERRRNF